MGEEGIAPGFRSYVDEHQAAGKEEQEGRVYDGSLQSIRSTEGPGVPRPHTASASPADRAPSLERRGQERRRIKTKPAQKWELKSNFVQSPPPTVGAENRAQRRYHGPSTSPRRSGHTPHRPFHRHRVLSSPLPTPHSSSDQPRRLASVDSGLEVPDHSDACYPLRRGAFLIVARAPAPRARQLISPGYTHETKEERT